MNYLVEQCKDAFPSIPVAFPQKKEMSFEPTDLSTTVTPQLLPPRANLPIYVKGPHHAEILRTLFPRYSEIAQASCRRCDKTLSMRAKRAHGRWGTNGPLCDREPAGIRPYKSGIACGTWERAAASELEHQMVPPATNCLPAGIGGRRRDPEEIHMDWKSAARSSR